MLIACQETATHWAAELMALDLSVAILMACRYEL